MAQENFNVSFPNDGLGDDLRNAFIKQQAMNTELYSSKVDKVTGQGLSENNFTNSEKIKLSGIQEGAEVNVQADWNQTDDEADDFIKNKPEINSIAVYPDTRFDYIDSTSFIVPENVQVMSVRFNGTSTQEVGVDWSQSGTTVNYLNDMEVGDFLIISGVFVIGSTLPTTLPNRTVKLVTTEAPYFLIQSDDDKFLTITTEFDPVLSLGFTANTEFWIKNTSPTPREVLFDTDIEFVGSPLIPTNGLAILKLIEVVGGVEYWSVNHLLANGTGGGGGDFIPLSGTEVGSPITGLIELKGGDGVDNPYLKFTSFFSDIKTYISYASNIDGVSYTGDFSIITKDETSESIMRFQPHEIEFQFNGMSKLRINENSIQGLSNFNKWFFASDTFDVQADVFFYDADEKAFAVGFADPTDSDTINFEFAIQNYSARIHSDFEDCKGIVGNRIFNKQSDYNAFAQLGDLPFANIQTSNFTAVNLVAYSTNGTVTVTDPTPETNKGYIVHVVGGTTTIGGVDYTAGALVYRFYDGTDWSSVEYAKKSDLLKTVMLQNTNYSLVDSGGTTQKIFNVGSSGNGSFPITSGITYEFKLLLFLEGLLSTTQLSFAMLGDVANTSNVRYQSLSVFDNDTGEPDYQGLVDARVGISFSDLLINNTINNTGKASAVIEGTFTATDNGYLIPAINIEQMSGIDTVSRGTSFTVIPIVTSSTIV